MRWLTALRRMTRHGIDTAERGLGRILVPDERIPSDTLGIVPLDGYGQLTGQELASAGATLAAPAALPTIEDMEHARERAEAFIERAATDVDTRQFGATYWTLQSAEVDADEEAATLAAEMDRIGHVEGAAIVGWVIRNAAIRAQLPIADLARPAEEITADALELAVTLLDSAQRLDPTFGGFVFSLQPERSEGLRFRDRFGDLWVYGD